MTKVCFVTPYAYSLFNRDGKHFPYGGSEVKMRNFGTVLARDSRYQVSFIVNQHKQPRREHFDGVTLYRHSFYKGENKLPFGVKCWQEINDYVAFSRKFPFIQVTKKTGYVLGRIPVVLAHILKERGWKALQRKLRASLFIDQYEILFEKFRVYEAVDADVYCVSGVHNLAAEVAAFCKQRGKRLVLFLAQELDVSETYRPGVQERNRYGDIKALCHYALMQADVIIAQTQYQASLLKERFGRDAEVILNPVSLSAYAEPAQIMAGNFALWVGRSSAVKRSDLLVEAARRLPQVPFVAVLNRHEPDLFDAFICNRPENIYHIEYIGLDKVETLFAQAFVLLNTSDAEGFPNTFLQAGKYGVPLLSLNVDPDGFITKHRCGIMAHGDFERFVSGVAELYAHSELRQEFSRNVRAYVENNHDLQAKTEQLSRILETL